MMSDNKWAQWVTMMSGNKWQWWVAISDNQWQHDEWQQCK